MSRIKLSGVIDTVGGLAATAPMFAWRYGTMRDEDIDPEHRTGAVLGSLATTGLFGAAALPLAKRVLRGHTNRLADTLSSRFIPKHPNLDHADNAARILDLARLRGLDSPAGRELVNAHGASLQRLAPSSGPLPSDTDNYIKHVQDNHADFRKRMDDKINSPEMFLAHEMSPTAMRDGVSSIVGNAAILPGYYLAHEVGAQTGRAAAEEAEPNFNTKMRSFLGKPVGLSRLTDADEWLGKTSQALRDAAGLGKQAALNYGVAVKTYMLPWDDISDDTGVDPRQYAWYYMPAPARAYLGGLASDTRRPMPQRAEVQDGRVLPR